MLIKGYVVKEVFGVSPVFVDAVRYGPNPDEYTFGENIGELYVHVEHNNLSKKNAEKLAKFLATHELNKTGRNLRSVRATSDEAVVLCDASDSDGKFFTVMLYYAHSEFYGE